VAFPLHPETPQEGLTLEELFAGRGVDIPVLLQHLKRVANECALPFGDRHKTYNSRRAQELGKWAESLGRGEEFHMAAFRAYFADGLNIAKVSVLTELAESVNLDAAEAERVLAGRIFKQQVDRDWAYSKANGITAVPTFKAAGMTVVGAQPYEELEKLVLAAGANRRQ
jgi:predicted DsbA family dithiol-disulfide isomerase